MSAGGTTNIDAWECAIRGWEKVERHVKEENAQGMRLLERAVELDPNYATAWAHLGWAHWTDALHGWGESRDVSLDLALGIAQKGSNADGDNPDVFAILGAIYYLRGKTEEAVAMMRKAVALSPSHADNAAFLAMVLNDAERPEEGLEFIKTAMRLSPIYPHWYLWGLGKSYRSMGQYELAIPAYQEAIGREPESVEGRIWLTDSLIEVRRIEEAKSAAKELLKLQPTFSIAGLMRDSSYDAPKREKIIKNLREAGLPE